MKDNNEEEVKKVKAVKSTKEKTTKSKTTKTTNDKTTKAKTTKTNADVEKKVKAKKVDEVKTEKAVEEVVVPVEVNEEIESKEEVKKENELNKFNAMLGKFGLNIQKLVIITFSILFVIFLAFFLTSAFRGKEKAEPNYPVVYVTDEKDLMVMSPAMNKPLKIESNFDDSVEVVYANNSAKKFIYEKNDSIYYYDVKKKKSTKIGSDVSDVIFSTDDKKILFIDKDDNLYVSNIKDKDKLDSDVDSIIAVTNKYVIYKKDGSLYYRNFKKKNADKTKITNDYKSAKLSEDEKTVLYSIYEDGTYDYHTYTLSNGKSTKVINDAYALFDYDDNFKEFVYGVKKTSATVDLSNILDDDKKSSDENLKECTYSDYLLDKCTEEEYDAYYDEKYDVSTRNSIREYIEDNNSTETKYDVYYVKSKKDAELIATDVDSVVEANYGKKEIVYTKKTINSNKKLKISDYSSLSSFKTAISELSQNELFYKKGNKDEFSLEKDVKSVGDVVIKSNELYFTLKKDSTYDLYYGVISGAKVKNVTKKVEKVEEDLYEIKKGIVYGTEYKSKSSTIDLNIISKGKSKSIATDVNDTYIKISKKEDKIYFLKDYNKEGTLCSYNGKVKQLAKDIATYGYVNEDTIYLVKNISTSGKVDLYYLKGKKAKEISIDVKDASIYID